MGSLTYCKPNGEWGIEGVDLSTLPPKVYGALCKLKDLEHWEAEEVGPLMGQLGNAAYAGYLRDLVQAEQDGRLVVLPCKAGDTVWFNTYAKNATVCLGVRPHKVSHFDISVVVPGEYIDTDLPLYEFGRSVFLTREEAEAALETQEENEK